MEKICIKKKIEYCLADFKIIRIIYIGSFGLIKLAQYLKTSTAVVLKVIMKFSVVSRSKTEYVKREALILKQIRNPFIVLLLGTFQDNENLYMVEEFVQGGDLNRLLREKRVFDLDFARFLVAEILCGLDHLHLRGVIYRALKPENILIDCEGHVKLVDFGMAKKLKDGERAVTLCGTPDYLAPEVILGEGHGEATDLWSLGIFLFEVLVGKPPFMENSIPALYHKILNFDQEFPKSINPVAEDLINSLLIKDQSERITIRHTKKHGFFHGFDWRTAENRLLTPVYLPRITSQLDSSNFPIVEEVFKTLPFVENVDLFPGF